MEIIKRYVHDVARRLPKRLRSDVAAELHSSLGEAHEAAVAEFNRESGHMATDDERENIAVDLVRNFGPPAALAASYRSGPQWLIGPDLYPAFKRTLKIVWLVIAALVLTATSIGVLQGDRGYLEAMAALTTGGLLSDLVSALGWVVLVFWIIQLTGRRRDGAPGAVPASPLAAARVDAWDPRELPAVDDPDVVSRSGLMVEIAIMLGLLVLFGVFPHAIGASVSVNGERGWVSLLGPGFLDQRSLLYIGFIGVAAMNMVLLRRGRWTTPTRIVDLILNLIFLVALARIVSTGDIVATGATDLVANGWSADAAADLSSDVFPTLDKLVRAVFGGIAISIAVHAARRGWTLFRALTR